MQGSQLFQSATLFAVLAFGVSLVVFYTDLEELEAPFEVLDTVRTFASNLFVLTSSARLSQADVTAINEQLVLLPVEEQPEAVIRWANATLPAKSWVQFTSFGLSGIAITQMLTSLGLRDRVPLVSLDTLHLFPETYDLVGRFKKYFEIGDQLHIFHPDHVSTREEFEKKFGKRLWKASPEVYGYVTKVEPTKRALDGLGVQAWITGRRRSQGGQRAQIALVEIDPSDRRIKLNPMASWVHDQVFQYVKDHKLPYNKLHDEGYTSIGDVVSTEKAEVSEGERGGRFKNQESKECGMHLSTDASSVSKMERLVEKISNGYEWDNEARERAAKIGIVTVTEENFEEVMAGVAPVLLEVYAPWCGHCRALERDWNKLARAVHTDGDDLIVARMDGWQNDVPAQYQKPFEATGVPRVYLLRPTASGVRSVELYEGEKEYSLLLEWVRERLAA